MDNRAQKRLQTVLGHMTDPENQYKQECAGTATSCSIRDKLGLKAGVITGTKIGALFKIARENHFAIPSVNVTGTNTANAVLETARDVDSPIIIQLSNGGSAFFCGKGISNSGQKASALGAVAAAHYIRQVAPHYGVICLVHTDHCAKKLLPWLDGCLDASEQYFSKVGEPLFSSHMIDLSEEPLKDNIQICAQYLKRMAAINCWLEIELGCTGGEEDGVDNTGLDNSRLYTQPADVAYAYEVLSKISPNFTIAASFGNVHGVYAPGNVKLEPKILKNCQEHIKQVYKTVEALPLNLVFHGGSGSDKEKIKEALGYGVVKMNIDTDTQWAFWDGIRTFNNKHKGYLDSQLGNPEGPQKPNKKYYDPREWLREGEKSLIKRLKETYADLNAAHRN